MITVDCTSALAIKDQMLVYVADKLGALPTLRSEKFILTNPDDSKSIDKSKVLHAISEPEFQINYMGHDWALDEQCRAIEGTWNYTYHNCVDMPNLETCEDNGGSLTCMSYEQMGHERDVCIYVCNFDVVDRK